VVLLLNEFWLLLKACDIFLIITIGAWGGGLLAHYMKARKSGGDGRAWRLADNIPTEMVTQTAKGDCLKLYELTPASL